MRFLTGAKGAAAWLTALMMTLLLSPACGGGGGSTPPPPPPPPPQAPIISLQPASQTVKEGDTATFSVVAAGTAPLAYQWKKGGVDIAGAAAASYTTPPTTGADSGSSFTVAVSNAGGSVTSNAATLTVVPAPVISRFEASPSTLTAGGHAALSFTFTGGTGSVDQGIGAVTSGTDVTITPAVTTTYQLTVVNGAGVTVAKTATATVVTAPVAPTLTAPTIVTAGTTGLTASVATQTGMTYLWTVSGGTITSGATTPQVTFTAGAAGTLTLHCAVANAAQNTASGSATVDVVAAPQATGLGASTTTPLYGAVVTLTPTFSGGTGSISPGIGAVTTGTAYPTPALTTAVTYTLTVTNRAGATATSVATLTPQAVTVAAISPATPTLTTLSTQPFTSSVGGAVNTGLVWSATGGVIDASTGLWTAPATAGTYTIQATSAVDATRFAITTATVVPAPVAVISTLGSAAAGRKGLLASVAAQPGMTFAWTISGGTITSAATVNPITYTADSVGTLTLNCTVTNAALATASGSAAVTVISAPWINTFTATPPAVTAGTAVVLQVDYVGGAGAIDNGIGPVAGQADVTVHPTITTTYTLTVTPVSGTAITQAVTVIVGTSPAYSTNLPGTLTVTQGTNTTLSVTASADPAITGYQWYFNGAPLPSKTEASLTLYSVAPADAGAYYVVATNVVGSAQSATLTLTVNSIHTISGRVTLVGDGTGIPGVTVSLDTSPSPTTTVTDSSGAFSFPGLLNGNYNLTLSMPAGTNVLFLPDHQAVTVADANVLDQSFQAALGYTVSGSVSYPGTLADRIYLRLDGGPGGVTPGLSLTVKGSFAIRGVPPGTYTLTAWMDTTGSGRPNASNPIGTRTQVVVGFADVSGADVSLADPAAIDLTGLVPSITRVDPLSGGATLRWNPVLDPQKVEKATSYAVEWSTSSTFATVAGSAAIPALGQEAPTYFASGLTDGTPYFFRLFAKAGTSTSAASATFGPVTPAAATGLHTVSGAVTFTGTATGPMLVGLYDQASQTPYVVQVATPVSPQAFTVSGVPSGTSYFVFAVIDQNGNGTIDQGDITNVDAGELARTAGNAPSLLSVASNLTGQDLSLPSAPATAYLGTSHQSYTWAGGTSENYGLQVDLRGNAKLPVQMTLQVGPATLDLARPAPGASFGCWFNHGALRPTLGEVLTVQASYSDGTSGDLPVTVTSVLDAFPTILPMGGTPVVPTFTWAAPIPDPGVPYTYRLWIAVKNGGTVWQYPTVRDMPATQLSVPFNVDGSAVQGALTPGITYSWSITLRDATGNSAQRKVDHTP